MRPFQSLLVFALILCTTVHKTKAYARLWPLSRVVAYHQLLLRRKVCFRPFKPSTSGMLIQATTSEEEARNVEGGVMEPMIQELVVPAYRFEEEDKELEQWAFFLTAVPIVVPFLAFLGYDSAVQLYHNVITFGQTWYVVDGGELERQLLIPVVNGIILPSISLVLATLTSTTVATLRQRQVIIRECLNKEVADLTTLASFVDGIFGRYEEDRSTRRRLLLHLRKYVERLIFESRSIKTKSSVDALASAKTSKNEIDLFQYEMVNAGAAHRVGDYVPSFDFITFSIGCIKF